MQRGYNIVSGGTDNHLFLLDLIGKDITGKDADAALGPRAHHGQQERGAERSAAADDHERPAHRHAGRRPRAASAKPKSRQVAELDRRYARSPAATDAWIERVRPQVVELCRRFPVYGGLTAAA